MIYGVRLTSTAEKERKQLSAPLRARMDTALEELEFSPRPPGVVKLSGADNDWRIRVGDYRILYEIDDIAKVVTVWRIAHRREVYRP